MGQILTCLAFWWRHLPLYLLGTAQNWKNPHCNMIYTRTTGLLKQKNTVIISPFPEDTGIYRISGSAWCFLAVDTAFWLYLWRLLRNNPENCETPSPCQTLSSCLRATRATLWRRLKVNFS